MFLDDLILQETETENDPLKEMIKRRDNYIADYNYYVKAMRELPYRSTPTRSIWLAILTGRKRERVNEGDQTRNKISENIHSTVSGFNSVNDKIEKHLGYKIPNLYNIGSPIRLIQK